MRKKIEKEEEEKEVEEEEEKERKVHTQKSRTAFRLCENVVSHYGKVCVNVGRDRIEQGQQTKNLYEEGRFFSVLSDLTQQRRPLGENNPYGAQH